MKNPLLIRTFLSLLLLVSLYCCAPKDPNKEIDEGKVTGETYTNDELGWQMTIPAGWDVIAKERLQAQQKKGLEMIEATLDTTVVVDGLRSLISFQKNQFNMFVSTSEPSEIADEAEWKEQCKLVRELIYRTF